LTPTLGAGGAAFAAVAARVWTTVVEVIPAAAFWLTGKGRENAAVRAKENSGASAARVQIAAP
jgi:hypothetical protein